MEILTKYFFPLLLAYGVPCLLWFLIHHYKPSFWPNVTISRPQKPWKDMLYALLAVAGILGLGQLWRAQLLLPTPEQEGLLAFSVWWINNLIIFSPVFITVLLRKQKLNTVFLSFSGFPVKIGFGLLTSFLGVELYMLFNGGHAWEIMKKGLEYENFKNFLPVFLEGVGLAFLFVRLKWVVGLKWAIAIPAVLFSLAHIPRALVNETALELVIVDSILTALVTVIVFATTARSRDIIWLGILHYFLDIAIGAFS